VADHVSTTLEGRNGTSGGFGWRIGALDVDRHGSAGHDTIMASVLSHATGWSSWSTTAERACDDRAMTVPGATPAAQDLPARPSASSTLESAGPLRMLDQATDPAELVRVCLVCGATMLDRGCKLRCPRCHYFASCSDYL
jgi:hypothetical protein